MSVKSHINRESCFLKNEAQKRKFRYISQLISVLFHSGNFVEISNLIVLALNGNENAFLDKDFFKNNDNLLYTFDRKNYLEEIKKIHKIVVNNKNPHPKFRLRLLKLERTLIHRYLKTV